MGAGQALSAIGSYQTASSQTAAKNQQIAANYNQRRVAYEKGNLDRLAIYNTKLTETSINQDEIGVAVLNAISTDTLAEAESDRQLEAALQKIKLAKLRGTGVADEGGRSRSFGQNQLRAAGRSEGAIAAQRERLSVGSFVSRRKKLEEANQARTAQWRAVNMGPGIAGPAPEMPTFLKGPSKLGLVVGLAGAAFNAAAPAFKSKPGIQGGGAGAGTTVTDAIPDMGYNTELMSGFVPSSGSYT